MSKYTITIRMLQKNNFDFGMTSYPIFDETYRNTLNNNILNYYYESEIGFETAPLFRKILNDRLTLIMPKYNKLYQAQNDLIQNGLLNNVNLRESMDRDITGNLQQADTGNASQSGSSNASNKNLYQDTPQGSVSMQTLESGSVYATNFTLDSNTNQSIVTDTSSSTRAQNTSGTDDYVKTIVGNNGRKYNVELFNNVVANLKNIDMMIIDELQDLFMGIF